MKYKGVYYNLVISQQTSSTDEKSTKEKNLSKIKYNRGCISNTSLYQKF